MTTATLVALILMGIGGGGIGWTIRYLTENRGWSTMVIHDPAGDEMVLVKRMKQRHPNYGKSGY
jgi:hypothetical protein